MESEPLISVTHTAEPPRPIAKGRPVDLIAALLASFAGLTAIIMAGIFFWGFAENDTHLPGLFSALIFSLILGSFAILPSIYIAYVALKGWREGLPRKSALRAFLLSLPWVILSFIFIRDAPIPAPLSWSIFSVSVLLFLWAGSSLVFRSSRNIDER